MGTDAERETPGGSGRPARVLVVDDDEAMRQLLPMQLVSRGSFKVSTAATADEALAHLRRSGADVVLTDLHMTGTNGIDLCRRIASELGDVPVILLTAFGSYESAVEALRAGAWDYVTKPVSMDSLMLALGRALKHRRLLEESVALRTQAPQPSSIVGQSAAIRRAHEMIERVADTDASVLVVGESGSGKELIARELHKRSPRREHPFVAVNCAAIPASLIESELFGHAKGAFTDAHSARQGLFVEANGGTLFLDEIGELPLEMQPKLLRALQERVVRPVGSNNDVPFDVRLVTATNRDLDLEVAERRFREDLYYRVNVVRIDVPPLRARGRDVLLLAQRFLERNATRSGKKINGLSRGASEKLLAYDWPGNVRELENCVEAAVALMRGEEVTIDDLPARIREFRPTLPTQPLPSEPSSELELLPLEEVERRYILHVLGTVRGNKSQAAALLGVDRRTLYRKLGRYSGESGPESGEMSVGE